MWLLNYFSMLEKRKAQICPMPMNPEHTQDFYFFIVIYVHLLVLCIKAVPSSYLCYLAMSKTPIYCHLMYGILYNTIHRNWSEIEKSKNSFMTCIIKVQLFFVQSVANIQWVVNIQWDDFWMYWRLPFSWSRVFPTLNEWLHDKHDSSKSQTTSQCIER